MNRTNNHTSNKIWLTLTALLALSACGSEPQSTEIAADTTAEPAASADHGGAAISIMPMASTFDVMTVILSVDGGTSYQMGYNPANGNFYSVEEINLPPGEHTLTARAYDVTCTVETCIPGVNQVGEGTATVTVSSGQVAAVYMRILDSSAPEDDTTNHAPVITTMIASSLSAGVGIPFEFQSLAIDPDGAEATAMLRYEWSIGSCTVDAGATSFSDYNQRNTSWQSSIAQDCTITITVRDGVNNYLLDSITTPPIRVSQSGIVLEPFAAWFIPRPAVRYILATDALGTVCAWDRNFSAGTCHMDFSQPIEFVIHTDAGVDQPSLDEIETTIGTDSYCGANFERVSEINQPNSLWVSYTYVWTPNQVYNNPCQFAIDANHLGMTDSVSMTLANNRFTGYLQMLDVESANDSTLTAAYIPYTFRSVVSEGNLGSADYYAIEVGTNGETIVMRTASAFGDPTGGFDTTLKLYEADAEGNLILLASDDNSGPGNFSELSYDFPASAEAHTYYLLIQRADAGAGDNTDLYSLYFDRYQ